MKKTAGSAPIEGSAARAKRSAAKAAAIGQAEPAEPVCEEQADHQEPDEESEPPRLPRPPRANACRTFVRKQIAKALPVICTGLLDRAKDGDLSTVKLLWQMAELDRPEETAGGRPDPTFPRRMLNEFRKSQASDGQSFQPNKE